MVSKKEGFTSMDTMTGSPIIDDLPNVRGIAPQQNPDFKPPYQDNDTPSPECEVLGDDLDMLETANQGLNQNLILPADRGPTNVVEYKVKSRELVIYKPSQFKSI